MDLKLRLVKAGLTKLLADALDETTAGNHKGLLKNSPHLGLFQQMPGYSPGLEIGSPGFTEANFAGYARKPVAFGPAGYTPDGRPNSHAASVLFSPTADTTPNTIVGVGLFDALVAGKLLGVAYLDDPVELNDEPDDLTVVVVFALPIAVPEWGNGATVP